MRVEAFGRHQMRSNATTVSSQHKVMFWMQKWDFLLMPKTWENSSQASSSSQNAARSRKSYRPTETPSAPTVTDTDTHLPDAPRNTPRAHIAHFIILVRPTAAKTPPAPREDTRSPSLGVARPSPPHCPNCGCDHDAFSRECWA